MPIAVEIYKHICLLLAEISFLPPNGIDGRCETQKDVSERHEILCAKQKKKKARKIAL